MTRRVSKNGKPYSEGSHMVRGDFPRDCYGCGLPTKLDDCWQETLLAPFERRSWHHACRFERIKVPA